MPEPGTPEAGTPEPGASVHGNTNPTIAAIALGSNLGDREQNLHSAIAAVGAYGEVLSVSRFIDTAPVGYLEQPRFLNGALLLATRYTPSALLDGLLAIEARMGRDRALVPSKGPRILDLDLIFYDSLVLRTPGLILPHPAMHQRAFVLKPLAELAPDWVHPLFGRTLLQILAELPPEVEEAAPSQC